MKRTTTKQWLEASLYIAVEFGYHCCEKGMNIQAAISAAMPKIISLVRASNLPSEIARIEIRDDIRPLSVDEVLGGLGRISKGDRSDTEKG